MVAGDRPRAVLLVRLQPQQAAHGVTVTTSTRNRRVRRHLALRFRELCVDRVVSRAPLDGIRVLDLTRLLPGAYATLLLADLGADVVKVEDPRGGDGMRTLPPLASGRNVYFEALNRNKRSITLDLRSPDAAAGPRRARSRAATSSSTAFARRPRGGSAWTSATLRAAHPRLICASISGFGLSGPYVERAAHDINYQALAGLLRPPALPGPLIGDIGAAMQTALAHPRRARRSGRAPAPAASSTCRFTRRRWPGRCFRRPAISPTPATPSTKPRTASGSRWARSSRNSGPDSASGSAGPS